MDEAEFQRKKAEMEPWYWWGIPTLLQVPLGRAAAEL